MSVKGFALFLLLASCAGPQGGQLGPSVYGVDPSQTADLSADHVKTYAHGTMSSEFIPERVYRAFLMMYPELFPGGDLSAYGAIYEKDEDLPLGFSRRKVNHLGSQVSVGINCAVCHIAEIYEAPEKTSVRVLGKPGSFDIYSFFGAFAVAMVKTADATNMEKFLHKYLLAGDPSGEQQKLLTNELMKQKDGIAKAIAGDPFGSKGIAPDALHSINSADLELNGEMLHAGADLVPLVQALLKLFHNIRTALHIPEQLPPPVPTLPGPGRTDAFGVLAAAFFNFPTTFEAPVKFGVVWNLSNRKWVHWDGNNGQPLVRNLGAALGLGAPMVGQGRLVDLAAVERLTDISERIRAPRYPWKIDEAAAVRGVKHYEARCASCHDTSEDKRLYTPKELGTDPNRAMFFDQKQAELLNKWVSDLQIEGYKAPAVSFRSTQRYWAADMAGVWARSPYLHNGSVRTMWELLSPAATRPKSFKVGSRVYDQKAMGMLDDGTFTFDTSVSGNSNGGHNYGTDLTDGEKRDLIEYLKTR